MHVNQPVVQPIRDLIAEGELHDALKEMRILLKNSPHLDEIDILLGRFNTNQNNKNQGIINHEQETLTLNQIRKSLLDLIRKIEEGKIPTKNILTIVKEHSAHELEIWETEFIKTRFKEGIIEEMIPTFQVGTDSHTSLRNLLAEYENKTSRHIMLLGKGGCGKSAALVALGKQLLVSDETIIPLFLVSRDLNKNKSISKNPIKSALADLYFENDYEKTLGALKEQRFILLLDGYNELNYDKPLFESLKAEFVEFFSEGIYPNLQILLSSRFEYHDLNVFTHFVEARVNDLEENKVNALLKERRIANHSTDIPLLLNPFNLGMLLLLGDEKNQNERNRSQLWRSFSQDKKTPYYLSLQNEFDRRAVLITGLLNLEIYEATKESEKENQSKNLTYYCLLVRHIAPRLASTMRASKNLFYFEGRNEIIKVIEQFKDEFRTKSFQDTFLKSFTYCESVIAEVKDLDANKIIDDLTNKLHVLSIRREEDQYEFFHQNLRDYFASLDLINRIILLVNRYPKKLNTKKIPKELMYPMEFTLKQIIGELLLEHRNIGRLDENKNWRKSHWNYTPLNQLAGRLRGKSDKTIGKTIWNIVTIWMEARNHDLAGENFQRLSLIGLNFYSSILTRKGRNGYLAADFSDAKMYYKQFFGDDYGYLQSIKQDAENKKLSIQFERSNLLLNITNRIWDYQTPSAIWYEDRENTSFSLKVHSESPHYYLTLEGSKLNLIGREYLGNETSDDNIDSYLNFVKNNTHDGIHNQMSFGNIRENYCFLFWTKSPKIELKRKIYLNLTEKFIVSSDLKLIVSTYCERGELPGWEYSQNRRKFDPNYDKWFLKVINQEQNEEKKIACSLPTIPVLFHPRSNKIIVVTADKAIAELDLKDNDTQNMRVLRGASSFEEMPFAYSPDGYCIFTSNGKQKKISRFHLESGVRVNTFFSPEMPNSFVKMSTFNTDKQGNIQSIFTCNDERTIWEWDYESGKVNKIYERFENKRWNDVRAIINESSTRIWIGTNNGYIREFDLIKKQCTLSAKICSEGIHKIVVFERKNVLIAHTQEHSHIADLSSGIVSHSVSLENNFFPLYCHYSECFYYSKFSDNATEQILCYSTETGQHKIIFEAKVSKSLVQYIEYRDFPGGSRAISPSGRYLLIWLFSSGHVLYDLRFNKRLNPIAKATKFDRSIFLEEDRYLTVKFDNSSFVISIYKIDNNDVQQEFELENKEIKGNFIGALQFLIPINKIVFTIIDYKTDGRGRCSEENIIFFCLKSMSIEIVKNKVHGSIGLYHIETFASNGMYGIIEERDYPASSLNFVNLKNFVITPALVKQGEYKYLNNLHAFFQGISQPKFLDMPTLSRKMMSELRHNGMKLKPFHFWQHLISCYFVWFDNRVRNLPDTYTEPFRTIFFLAVLFYLLLKNIVTFFFSLALLGLLLSPIAMIGLYFYRYFLQYYDEKILKANIGQFIVFALLIALGAVIFYGAVKMFIKITFLVKANLIPNAKKQKYRYLPEKKVDNEK